MSVFSPETDPMDTDPGKWGHSLANLSELVLGAIDIASPRSIVEVGAYAGDTTRLLLGWLALRGAETRLISIDPAPHELLTQLASETPALDLVLEPSLEALAHLPRADVYVVDGDHNHYTVSHELAAIAETARASEDDFPLVICHDVGWPHARRDSYYAPERIPSEGRQPVADGGWLYPGVPGLHEGGLVYPHPAEREGGEHNGVLTAIEDFLRDAEPLGFALIPAFFGLGVIWSPDAPYAEDLEQFLGPWDRNPLLARLEANRVELLASRELAFGHIGRQHDAIQAKDAVLSKLLISGALNVAVAISKLRHRGEAAFSKDEIGRALSGE